MRMVRKRKIRELWQKGEDVWGLRGGGEKGVSSAHFQVCSPESSDSKPTAP